MQFEALGRDIVSYADSYGDSAIAGAIKNLVLWAELHSDHLYEVAVVKGDNAVSVSIAVKQKDVYEPLPYPSQDATPEELARSGYGEAPPELTEASGG